MDNIIDILLQLKWTVLVVWSRMTSNIQPEWWNEPENVQIYGLECQFIKRVALDGQTYLVPVNYTQNSCRVHQLMSVKSMGAKTRLFTLTFAGFSSPAD